MGDARTVTALQIITVCLYELRDIYGTNYNRTGSHTEMLGYLNRCLDEIHHVLVDEKSELVRTGTGTITTVAGTQSYSLSSNSMGDLLIPHRVWISTYEPMSECEEEDLYDAINTEESGDTSRTIPDAYCIVGDYIWFKDVPDDAYTVNLRYFPNFVPLSATTSTLPFKNLFNNELIEGVKILAKHRNDIGVNVDAVLKDIFRGVAIRVARKRRRRDVSIVPGRW